MNGYCPDCGSPECDGDCTYLPLWGAVGLGIKISGLILAACVAAVGVGWWLS